MVTSGNAAPPVIMRGGPVRSETIAFVGSLRGMRRGGGGSARDPAASPPRKERDPCASRWLPMAVERNMTWPLTKEDADAGPESPPRRPLIAAPAPPLPVEWAPPVESRVVALAGAADPGRALAVVPPPPPLHGALVPKADGSRPASGAAGAGSRRLLRCELGVFVANSGEQHVGDAVKVLNDLRLSLSRPGSAAAGVPPLPYTRPGSAAVACPPDPAQNALVSRPPSALVVPGDAPRAVAVRPPTADPRPASGGLRLLPVPGERLERRAQERAARRQLSATAERRTARSLAALTRAHPRLAAGGADDALPEAVRLRELEYRMAIDRIMSGEHASSSGSSSDDDSDDVGDPRDLIPLKVLTAPPQSLMDAQTTISGLIKEIASLHGRFGRKYNALNAKYAEALEENTQLVAAAAQAVDAQAAMEAEVAAKEAALEAQDAIREGEKQQWHAITEKLQAMQDALQAKVEELVEKNYILDTEKKEMSDRNKLLTVELRNKRRLVDDAGQLHAAKQSELASKIAALEAELLAAKATAREDAARLASGRVRRVHARLGAVRRHLAAAEATTMDLVDRYEQLRLASAPAPSLLNASLALEAPAAAGLGRKRSTTLAGRRGSPGVRPPPSAAAPEPPRPITQGFTALDFSFITLTVEADPPVRKVAQGLADGYVEGWNELLAKLDHFWHWWKAAPAGRNPAKAFEDIKAAAHGLFKEALLIVERQRQKFAKTVHAGAKQLQGLLAAAAQSAAAQEFGALPTPELRAVMAVVQQHLAGMPDDAKDPALSMSMSMSMSMSTSTSTSLTASVVARKRSSTMRRSPPPSPPPAAALDEGGDAGDAAPLSASTSMPAPRAVTRKRSATLRRGPSPAEHTHTSPPATPRAEEGVDDAAGVANTNMAMSSSILAPPKKATRKRSTTMRRAPPPALAPPSQEPLGGASDLALCRHFLTTAKDVLGKRDASIKASSAAGGASWRRLRIKSTTFSPARLSSARRASALAPSPTHEPPPPQQQQQRRSVFAVSAMETEAAAPGALPRKASASAAKRRSSGFAGSAGGSSVHARPEHYPQYFPGVMGASPPSMFAPTPILLHHQAAAATAAAASPDEAALSPFDRSFSMLSVASEGADDDATPRRRSGPESPRAKLRQASGDGVARRASITPPSVADSPRRQLRGSAVRRPSFGDATPSATPLSVPVEAPGSRRGSAAGSPLRARRSSSLASSACASDYLADDLEVVGTAKPTTPRALRFGGHSGSLTSPAAPPPLDVDTTVPHDGEAESDDPEDPYLMQVQSPGNTKRRALVPL
eukprot:TRINITY_DN7956_c0_g1_i3.p1 TRINITY_DN7956_c0_g1~~TRINITY_DN7956_c0_g1_i3.p1  ORF type:complete len:1296 (+),score=421.00 TRINITY_DN7956_c0_g1_i3:125-4012(+)